MLSTHEGEKRTSEQAETGMDDAYGKSKSSVPSSMIHIETKDSSTVNVHVYHQPTPSIRSTHVSSRKFKIVTALLASLIILLYLGFGGENVVLTYEFRHVKRVAKRKIKQYKHKINERFENISKQMNETQADAQEQWDEAVEQYESQADDALYDKYGTDNLTMIEGMYREEGQELYDSKSELWREEAYVTCMNHTYVADSGPEFHVPCSDSANTKECLVLRRKDSDGSLESWNEANVPRALLYEKDTGTVRGIYGQNRRSEDVSVDCANITGYSPTDN